MRRWMEEHEVLTVAGVAALVFVLWYLRFVWAVALIGFIVAVSLVPFIAWLEKRGLPRALAIVLTFVGGLAALIGVFVPAILSVMGQGTGLTKELTEALERMLGPDSFASQFGLNADTIISFIRESIVPFTTSAAASVAGIVTAIVVSVYLLLDWPARERALAKSPSAAQRTLVGILKDSERELGAWARGEIILALSIGILTFFALFLIGIPYAGPLAALAGIFELIPYAGPILAAIPAVLLALGLSGTDALITAGAYLVIQQIENHVIVPIVMRNAIRMHPVVIIIALLTGFELMGIVGAIIAVPIVALVRIVLTRAGIL